MAQREPVMRQQSKPRKKAKPLKAPERSGFFPVVTSNVLNMICVTTVVATVLAVLLGVAKWTWRSKNRRIALSKDSTAGDTVSSYTGTYVQDGDKFAAAIAVKRHAQGLPSVFGIDNVDITLSGKSTPTTASCFGTANQAPGTTLQATLIRIVDR
jgi:hypothetical protein